MKKCIRYSFFILAIVCSLIGITLSLYNFLFLSVICLFVNNIIYCLENLNDRIVLLMFHVTIFVFLLSRPLIEFCSNLSWENKYIKNYGTDAFQYSLIALGLSLLFLFAGGMLADKYLKKKRCYFFFQERKNKYKDEFVKNLRIIAEVIFYFSMLMFMIVELEKLWFMRGKSYLEYYTSYASTLPYIIHVLASFMRYSLCIFLATFPSKKRTILPLGLYIFSAIPSLIIGIRNPIMLNGLFTVIYFCIRNMNDSEEKWLGKFEKIGMVICIPAVLIFMGAYSSIRSGNILVMHGVGKMLVDFFYGQGVSFKVLMIGYTCIDMLPQRQFRNYTFGGIVDYFLHGSIAQNFYGAVSLDNTNNIQNAMLSNNFSHNMSYISKGEKYLNGQGWGSSYLLETFVDYGYIGIVVYSILLAIILVIGVSVLKKSCFGGTVFLLITTQVFFAPRAEATGFLNFIVQIRFWFTILVCFLGAALCCKKYDINSLRSGKDV